MGLPSEDHVKRLFGYAIVLLLLGAAAALAASLDAAGPEKGRTLYRDKCQFCHGIRGDGKGPAAESLLAHPVDFTDSKFWQEDVTKKIYETITHGKEMMPPFDLTPDDVAAITSYISHTFKNAPQDDKPERVGR
jgi:mono/diheme cytochrome c family protein